MKTKRTLIIAATLTTLMSLAPPVYANGDPVTQAQCVNNGGVVFTDANGFRVCNGGTFDGRYVV
jgi:hypothetical protein